MPKKKMTQAEISAQKLQEAVKQLKEMQDAAKAAREKPEDELVVLQLSRLEAEAVLAAIGASTAGDGVDPAALSELYAYVRDELGYKKGSSLQERKLRCTGSPRIIKNV